MEEKGALKFEKIVKGLKRFQSSSQSVFSSQISVSARCSLLDFTNASVCRPLFKVLENGEWLLTGDKDELLSGKLTNKMRLRNAKQMRIAIFFFNLN